jgi:hypothetical protein
MVAGKEAKNEAADCAPCVDCNLMLEQQMEKLDNMELVDGNNSTCYKTDDDKVTA